MPTFRIKTCFRCKSEFLPAGPHQLYCTACRVQGYRENSHFDKSKWLIDNADLIRQKDRERYQRPDRRQYVTEWREKNKERRRQQAKESYWSSPQKNREAVRLRRITHPDRAGEIDRKKASKRRTLGFVPINKSFVGSDAHHYTKNEVIYIPKKLHRSVWHNIWTGLRMEEINKLAFSWYTEDWT